MEVSRKRKTSQRIVIVQLRPTISPDSESQNFNLRQATISRKRKVIVLTSLNWGTALKASGNL